MNTHTHAAAAEAIYTQLPVAAREFLNLSPLELRHWARVPDEQDHDALEQTGCDTGEECHAHSYKLGPDGVTHLTGSAPTVLAQAPRQCVSACREGDFDQAREVMVKAMSHYALDLSTPWHTTRDLTSAQHRDGEKHLGTLTVPTPVPVKLAAPRSLYRSAILQAQETHRLFVTRLVAGEPLDVMADDILTHAVNFGLAVGLYVWRWLDRAD